MANRYYLSLNDPGKARGTDTAFAFTAQGAAEYAAQLQQALRSDDLFNRWRNAQPEPDEVDDLLSATDPAATVSGEQNDLRIDLVAVTSLPGSILKHRLNLLAGSGWELRDVAKA